MILKLGTGTRLLNQRGEAGILPHQYGKVMIGKLKSSVCHRSKKQVFPLGQFQGINLGMKQTF